MTTILDTLAMFHAIEAQKIIYNIHYCRAGVGFIFYDGPTEPPDDWRKHLVVKTYHPTFEDAVQAEFNRLSTKKATP